jgi:hypothetical protein
MRFHGFIVGVVLAVMAGSAWGSGPCWSDTEKGPWTCNCTDSEVGYTGCSSSSVEVKSGNEGGITSYFPGLSGTAKKSYSETVSTGNSECVNAQIPPHQCAWFEYQFQCCLTKRIVEGFFFDSVEWCVTVTYLGKSFICAPAPPGACP